MGTKGQILLSLNGGYCCVMYFFVRSSAFDSLSQELSLISMHILLISLFYQLNGSAFNYLILSSLTKRVHSFNFSATYCNLLPYQLVHSH